MGSVFSQATKVNVWLGRGESIVIEQAFESSKLIANVCREFSLLHDLDLDEDETLEAVEVAITVFTPTVCDALEELLIRPLFSIVWCVQEVLLARDALVIWGEHELPWKDIGLTATWIARKWSACEINGELHGVLTGMASMQAVYMYTFDPFETSLLEALSDFREFQSTDPKDKVYGLISLIKDEPDIGSIIPDYDKSVAHVYAETALHVLSITQHLLMFAHISHDADYDGRDEYRSWAPRWDCTQIPHMISNGLEVSGVGACDGREVQILGTTDSKCRQLCLIGIFHAKVKTVDSIFDMSFFSKSRGIQMYHQVVEVLEGIDGNDPMRDATLSVLARTLTTGICTTTGQHLHTVDDETRCAYYEGFRHYLKWYRTPTADCDSLRGDALRYHHMLTMNLDNLRFFWTSRKDYGVGPACMREGDIVVVFYGGGAPCVLRPKGDKYLMLGEAYVDSIMNGELVREVEEGKRQEQEFCLI